MLSTNALVSSLLEELLRVQDVEEACSLAVERLGSAAGLERAVLIVRTGSTWRGAARHLSYSAMGGLLATLNRGGATLSEFLDDLRQPLPLRPGLLPGLAIENPLAIPCPAAAGQAIGLMVLPMPDDGAPAAVLAAALRRLGPLFDLRRDVEALSQTVRCVTAQSDLVRQLIDTLEDPVLMTDERNDIVFANARAEHLLVANASDSEGRRRAVQINNLLLSSFLTRSLIGGPSGSGRELNLVDTEDGSDLLFEVLSMPSGESGNGRAISVLRDITDLKRALGELESQFRLSRSAEHRARRERDRLNVILENVGEPILVTDEQSNIILMNTEAERLFMPGEDLADDAAARQRVQSNDTRVTTLLSDFVLSDETRRVQRLDILDPLNGHRFPAEVVSSKILNTRGEPIAIVSVLHDLSQAEENERLAAELQTLNEQLEERVRRATAELEERNRQLQWQSRQLEKASQLKTEFLASMSHELRTPLNVVLGYTSLLQEGIYGDLNEPQVDALGRIHVTSQHLLELINNILDLSKIEAGMMPVNVERVDVRALIGELSEIIAPIVRKKGLQFDQRVPPDLPAMPTDRVKLKQILLNLLSNAIKFTPAGVVSIAVEKRGRGLWIEVEDSGIGIREEHLRDIFEAFRQIDQSHTREFAGTGLGLSITKKLLDLLGGSIDVHSTVGRGSRFAIHLPPRELPSAGGAAESTAAPAAPVASAGRGGRSRA